MYVYNKKSCFNNIIIIVIILFLVVVICWYDILYDDLTDN